VYFIQAETDGLIKIGTSEDPLLRMGAMQSGCPVILKLLGCIKAGRLAEREIHERFAEERRHFEWFEPSDRLVAFIDFTLAEKGVPFSEYGKRGMFERPKTLWLPRVLDSCGPRSEARGG